MNAKKPELQDFRITPEEYDLYVGKRGLYPSDRAFGYSLAVIFVVAFSSLYVGTRDLGIAFWLGLSITAASLMLVVPIVGSLVKLAITHYQRDRLLGSPIVSRIELYEEALAAYQNIIEDAKRARREAERQRWEAERARERAEWARQKAERERLRKLSEYWTSLSGVAFERELANLYRRLGYLVETTPGSGDQGIDLIVKKDGLTTIVQCKAHKSPVGPAIARELYGSLVAYGADLAILASTGGFTQGVKDFARGKPIALISAYELAALGERGEALPEQSIPPICPAQGCGKTMVTRTGRYGTFWGCPTFPKCKGTREYRGQ